MIARSFFTALRMAALLVVASMSLPAQAQEWPPHNLRILVPFPAGGSADIQARAIADELSKKLGKPVVIENKPRAPHPTAPRCTWRRPARTPPTSIFTTDCPMTRSRISSR